MIQVYMYLVTYVYACPCACVRGRRGAVVKGIKHISRNLLVPVPVVLSVGI